MFEKPLKNFFTFFFIFALFLIVGLVKGFTANDPNLPKISTVEEYQQLQESIHYLASDDENKRLESVYHLKKFAHYFEVKKILLGVLLTELDRSTPDIPLMTTIVAAISPFLSSQDTNHLNQLKKRITALIDKVILKNPKEINLYSFNEIQDSKAQNTLLTSRLYFLSSRSDSDGVEHIRSFQKGSLRFLTDDLFFKGSYRSRIRQQEAHQVIDVLSQKEELPILIGSEESNKTIIHKVTQNVADTTPQDTKETYIVETTPSQINKIAENASSNSPEAMNLEIYLDAILYIEEKLNIRIIVFMNEFHRLNASQMGVLNAYLQRERPIQLIAASTMERYQAMSQYLFDFREIIASRLSIKDLKNVMIDSILPKLQQEHFNFHISIKAIYNIINYIYARSDFHNESLFHIAEKLLIDLLIKKRQSITASGNTELYSQPIQITDEDVRQFILNLQIPHQQQNTTHEACGPSLM